MDRSPPSGIDWQVEQARRLPRSMTSAGTRWRRYWPMRSRPAIARGSLATSLSLNLTYQSSTRFWRGTGKRHRNSGIRQHAFFNACVQSMVTTAAIVTSAPRYARGSSRPRKCFCHYRIHRVRPRSISGMRMSSWPESASSSPCS